MLMKTKPNYEPLTRGNRREELGKRLDQSGKLENEGLATIVLVLEDIDKGFDI